MLQQIESGGRYEMRRRLTAICLAVLMIVMTPAMALAASSGELYSYSGTGFDTKRGNSGSLVTRIQQRLIDLGYLSGSADGKYGPKTEAAVKEFQRKNGIHGESGYAGVATRFTQARLFSGDVITAGSNYLLRLDYNGNYAVRNYQLTSQGGNTAKLSFTFVNQENATVEAVKYIYWLEDYNGRLVEFGGYMWYDTYWYDLNIGYNETKELYSTFTPSSSEWSRAGQLRMMIAEIAYSDGEVYITCDPSTNYNYQASYLTGWA